MKPVQVTAWDVDPMDLRLEMGGSQWVWPGDPGDAVGSWWSRFVVWDPSDATGGTEVCVAEASLFVVTGREGVDLVDALEDLSGDTSLFAPLVASRVVATGARRVRTRLPLVIVDEVEVPAVWRGRALGSSLVAASLVRLLAGGGMAAVGVRSSESDARYVDEQTRLRRLAERIGFRRFDDEVMVCGDVRRLERSLGELHGIVGRRR